jgi:8-oxo-dGTP pyrophosphatase MutT (NUDIX family)
MARRLRREVRMSWRVTVAAVVERDGRFLVVEERDPASGAVVWNQPAGHVDPGEGLLAAVVRETLEETGLAFTPEALLGVYQLRARDGRDYCRVCFVGSVPPDGAARPLDPVILACHWLTRDEIAAGRPRSGLVLRCVDDALAGRGLPLEAASLLLDERPLPEAP